MGVHQYRDFSELPEAARDLLAVAGNDDFFTSVPWFQAVLTTASTPGDQLCVFVAEDANQPTAVLVAKRRRDAGALRSRMILSLSHRVYASLYAPVLQNPDDYAGLRDIIAEIINEIPRFDMLRLDNLDQSSPTFGVISDQFKSAGMIVQPFFLFHNWYENVSGLSIEQYLAIRPQRTRYLINRHVHRFQQLEDARVHIVTDEPGLENALIDYELVHVQSWKGLEPSPACVPQIVRSAARAGALRLGLLYVDREPAAAQIWIVSGGKATIFRRHFASKFAKLGVGTVLTYEIFRHVLQYDRVQEIDFGIEDDSDQRNWLTSCRARRGMLVLNPRTFKGCISAARHVGGHLLMNCGRKLTMGKRNDLSPYHSTNAE